MALGVVEVVFELSTHRGGVEPRRVGGGEVERGKLICSFPSMGQYADYAKSVLQAAFPDRWTVDDNRIFSFGPDAGTGEVSGVLDGRIAVQIACGSYKQIRGGLLDVIWHPYEVKLLVMVDTPQHSAAKSLKQAGTIMAGSKVRGGVVRLAGTPQEPKVDVDLLAVQEFVEGLGEGVRMLDVGERWELDVDGR